MPGKSISDFMERSNGFHKESPFYASEYLYIKAIEKHTLKFFNVGTNMTQIYEMLQGCN